MNNSHDYFARIAGRGALALAMLTLTVGSSLGAERSAAAKTDTAPSAEPKTSQPSETKTSISNELQKLFKKSGTPMPSMRKEDLPYANSPQMHRVRKRQETPEAAAPTATAPVKKKKNLLSRFFGRFRRDKSQDETTAARPPAIVNRNVAPNSPRDAKARTSSQQSRVAQSNVAKPVRPSGRAPSQVVRPAGSAQSRKIVRPASDRKITKPQPRKAVVKKREEKAEMPRVDLATQDDKSRDEFANPFEEFDLDADKEESLDLDTAAADSEPAESNPFAEQSVAERSEKAEQTEAAIEEKANPFTGLRISDEDEFASPFEDKVAASIDDAADKAAELIEDSANPFAASADVAANDFDQSFEESIAEMADEAQQAVEEIQVVPARTVSSLTESTVEENQGSKFAPIEEPQGSESLARAWRTSENAATTQTETAARSRRLAGGRAPAERQQAERWQENESKSEEVSRADKPAFGERITAAPASQSKKLTPAEIRRQKIEARKDLTGFQGFCPVALREERDLVDASKEFEATFGLNTYQFSSAEAVQQFEANPTRYAPAAGGSDVVALVNSGEQHAGSLKFAMWYRDRLYLFRSAATMRLFRQDPASFADQY